MEQALSPEDFLPATEEEKQYTLPVRPATTFFRDGMKRLLKNKVATISAVLLILVVLLAVSIGTVVVGILKLVYLYQSAQLFRNYEP